jgi:TatD DNase family protein
MKLGYYISIPGTVTFKNALQIQEVVRQVPLERLLVETDAPFLAPVPYRGKRNEPAYVRYTAAEAARLKKIPLEVFAEQTTRNACHLFGIPEPS